MSTYVGCSRCGKRVSNLVNVVGGLPFVVRAWVECPECIEAQPEVHAYGVEVQVNPGRPSAYWRLDDDEQVRETVEEAADQRQALIDLGYDPEHVRIVSLTVVAEP